MNRAFFISFLVFCAVSFGMRTESAYGAEVLNASKPESTEPVKDEIAENILNQRNFEKPVSHLIYDYKSTKTVPIRFSIKERIKSEADVYEGQIVEFEAQSDVYFKKDLKIKKGDTIKARVGTVITSGMNGIPASIIFDNFEFPNIKKGQTEDRLEVFGQDRSLVVFPLKWALTILPPSGSLTNFIMGGHVKIKEGKVFTMYYHPEWL